MRRSNCLVWALRQKWRYGGRVYVVRSPHGHCLPRFIWRTGEDYWYYGPLFPRRDWRAIPHAFWFSGEVRRCDRNGVQTGRKRYL